MLSIRLQRTGKKNQPKFRIVLINNKRAPKSGAFKEILGYYDPITKKAEIKKDRIEEWQRSGVKVSASALNILKTFKNKL